MRIYISTIIPSSLKNKLTNLEQFITKSFTRNELVSEDYGIHIIENNNIYRIEPNFNPDIHIIKKFLNSELLIDNTYSVTGHATIVSGMLKSGTIKPNDNLILGPFYDSTYRQVKVRSIHLNYKELKEATAGYYICISLKNIFEEFFGTKNVFDIFGT